MGIAVDTSVFVAIERQGKDFLDALPDEDQGFYLPAPVVAELWIGVELADSPERRAARLHRIAALLAAAEVLPFDERVAPAYARIYALLRRTGTPIPANDLAIAAIAIHHGHDLLVGPSGEEHFRRIPELVVRVLAGK